MQKLAIMAVVLALAGCAVNSGGNINYSAGGDSPYGKYRTAREVALTTGAPAPAVIPMARPFTAPTASDIAPARVVPAAIVTKAP